MPVLLAPALATGLGISAGSASVLSSIIFAAGSMLLSYLLAPKPPKPDDGLIPFKQSVPPRGYGYGTVRVTGAVVCLEGYSRKGDLLKVHALLSHECDSFVDYYLHEDNGSIGGDGKFKGGPGRRYGKSKDRVEMRTRLGVVPETVYDIIEGRTPLWGSNHRGDGICSMAIVCFDSSESSQSKDYPFGPPIPSAVVRAAKVFDPRDEDQDVDDKSTWVWSDNPVLCIMHYICFNEFGFGRDYTTTILPYIDNWKAEADICDELVDTQTGTEKRYRLSGHATTENEQKAVLAQMLATCDGWLVDRGDGGMDIVVGYYRAPTITLTDDDIVGFNVPYGVPDETAVNRLSLTFTDPSNKYAEVETTPWEDEDDQVSRGRISEHKYELIWVFSKTQCRRLGYREFQRLTAQITGTIDVRIDSINAAYDRWVKVESALIPRLGDLVIEIRRAYLSLLTGTVRLDFIAVDPDTIELWDPTDEGDPAPVDEPDVDDIEGTFSNGPQNVVWTVYGTGEEGEYGDERVYVEVTFDDPEQESWKYTARHEWNSKGLIRTFTHEDLEAVSVGEGRLSVTLYEDFWDTMVSFGTVIGKLRFETSLAQSDWSPEVTLDLDSPAHALLATTDELLSATATQALRVD